jgi:hypothetical protein
MSNYMLDPIRLNVVQATTAATVKRVEENYQRLKSEMVKQLNNTILNAAKSTEELKAFATIGLGSSKMAHDLATIYEAEGYDVKVENSGYSDGLPYAFVVRVSWTVA